MRIRALRTFMQRDGDRPRLLVRIDTDEGVSGWGECYNHGPDRALAAASRVSSSGRSWARTRGGSSSSS